MPNKKSKNKNILKKRMSFSILQMGLFALVFGLVGAFLIIQTFAAPSRSADSIWVVAINGASSENLKYGDSFKADYTSRVAKPWGFAECWANDTTKLGTPSQGTYQPGDVIWSEYRSLYPDGPVPAPFKLIDPIQNLWLGGGADCQLSLIKFVGANYGKKTVLATTKFTVAP